MISTQWGTRHNVGTCAVSTGYMLAFLALPELLSSSERPTAHEPPTSPIPWTLVHSPGSLRTHYVPQGKQRQKQHGMSASDHGRGRSGPKLSTSPHKNQNENRMRVCGRAAILGHSLVNIWGPRPKAAADRSHKTSTKNCIHDLFGNSTANKEMKSMKQKQHQLVGNLPTCPRPLRKCTTNLCYVSFIDLCMRLFCESFGYKLCRVCPALPRTACQIQ